MHLTTKQVFCNETGVLHPIVRFATKQAFCNETGVLQPNRRFAMNHAFCNQLCSLHQIHLLVVHILDIHRCTW